MGVKLALVRVKKSLGIPLHSRPPSSPDLNPMENVWRVINQRMKARDNFSTTVEKLKEAVQEE